MLKKDIIIVKVYRKNKRKWEYWKTLEFSDFKYFVEKFINGLLEEGCAIIENWACPGFHFVELVNEKKKIKYYFDINNADMDWLIDYMGAWYTSPGILRKN